MRSQNFVGKKQPHFSPHLFFPIMVNRFLNLLKLQNHNLEDQGWSKLFQKSVPPLESCASLTHQFNSVIQQILNTPPVLVNHVKWVLEIQFREGNGNPLQSSCLENPMDGGAWWAAVYGVAKSRTRLSNLTFTFHFHALEKEMATHSSVLAGESQGQQSLVGSRLWGRTELDTTEVT